MSFVFIGLFVILNILLRWNNITHYTFSPFDHFQGTRMYEPAIPIYQELLEKTEDYPDVIMIDVSGMFYEIVSNRKIDYFGVALRGNYGYGGTKKMISQMEAMENTYFVVNEAIYEDVVSGKPVDSQFDTELIEYVIKHYEKAGQTEIYTIYYKQ